MKHDQISNPQTMFGEPDAVREAFSRAQCGDICAIGCGGEGDLFAAVAFIEGFIGFFRRGGMRLGSVRDCPLREVISPPALLALESKEPPALSDIHDGFRGLTRHILYGEPKPSMRFVNGSSFITHPGHFPEVAISRALEEPIAILNTAGDFAGNAKRFAARRLLFVISAGSPGNPDADRNDASSSQSRFVYSALMKERDVVRVVMVPSLDAEEGRFEGFLARSRELRRYLGRVNLATGETEELSPDLKLIFDANGIRKREFWAFKRVTNRALCPFEKDYQWEQDSAAIERGEIFPSAPKRFPSRVASVLLRALEGEFGEGRIPGYSEFGTEKAEPCDAWAYLFRMGEPCPWAPGSPFSVYE